MTRFARAKGSKASNERVPEDSTPWAVMKEQLQRAKQDAEHADQQKQAEKQRIENYENFLNERKTAKRKSTWCEFPEENNSSQNFPHKKLHKGDGFQFANTPENSSQCQPPKKKKKNSQDSSLHAEEKTDNVEQHQNEQESKKIKKKKNKNKQPIQTNNNSEIDKTESAEEANRPVKNKKQNNTKITTEKTPESSDVKPIKKKKQKHTDHKQAEQNIIHNKLETNANSNKTNEPNNQQKKKNKRNGPKVRRKPENDRSFQIIINGRQVDLVRFEGFPVMKKDAERLQQLRKDMASKGIPKREIDRTMKLERRRAEKALARVKREVCYNCRKGGHNISSCPDLRSIIPDKEDMTDASVNLTEAADGICFKCGSTEHRQSECRVQKGQQFRFASCFICKEQGHIARQCPDNPKGLYPNGGSCKLCGDVTHLRKDCPTTSTSRQETSVRLETLVPSNNVEDFAENNVSMQQPTVAKKAKKIKF